MPDPPKELLERLAATPEYTYPLELLTEIKARLPEMTPALLQVLEHTREAPRDFADDSSSWMLPVFAAYFLAEARETGAWKPLIALLNLPANEADRLFGDMITEDMDRVLASVFDGDEAPLRDLVENPEADEFVRACGLGCYVHLLQNRLVSREAVTAYFTALMRGRLKDSNDVVWSNLAIYCGTLGLAHLIPDIQTAYADGRCDPMVDSEENVVHQAGNGGDPAWLVKAALIGDTIELTRHWHCFQPKPAVRPALLRGNIKIPQFAAPPLSTTPRSTPKIGRNDPCPCGSGKKYKKCCGG